MTYEDLIKYQKSRLLEEIIPRIKKDFKNAKNYHDTKLPSEPIIAAFYKRLIREIENMENQLKE